MIAEAVLLDALEAVHSGRLRVHEAYRTIRAAEVPEQLDRDDLIDHIRNTVWHESEAVATAEEVADGIIARLRPVDGVTLTRKEAEICSNLVAIARVARGDHDGDLRSLGVRLEATS